MEVKGSSVVPALPAPAAGQGCPAGGDAWAGAGAPAAAGSSS